ncbi:MAG: hypothetical protein NTU79_12665 [Planctomycetota bacterium]|nr:hypothetical protein [Planctomycetota bacterium]
MDSQSRWLAILGKLRVNRSQGLAPHKPLLLLVVLEMIENGDLQSPDLKLTPELAFRFSQFGIIVAHRRTQRMDIRLPFYHLSSDTVWSGFTKDGSQSLDPKSNRYVKIDAEFFALAQDLTFRKMARVVLIRTGLWSLDDDYRVIVSHGAFDEEARDQKPLRDFHGSRIALPSNAKLWPGPQHLAWHRENRLCA